MTTHAATTHIRVHHLGQRVVRIRSLEVDLDPIQSLKVNLVQSRNEDLVLDLERSLILNHVVDERAEISENLRVDRLDRIVHDHHGSHETEISLANQIDKIVKEVQNQDQSQGQDQVLALVHHRDLDLQVESLSDSLSSAQ